MQYTTPSRTEDTETSQRSFFVHSGSWLTDTSDLPYDEAAALRAKQEAVLDKYRAGLFITNQEIIEAAGWKQDQETELNEAKPVKKRNKITRPSAQHMEHTNTWNTPAPDASAPFQKMPRLAPNVLPGSAGSAPIASAPTPTASAPAIPNPELAAAAPMYPTSQPGKAPTPRQGTAPESAASAQTRQHDVAQVAMIAWLLQGSRYHETYEGNMALRGLLREQGMKTIWDTHSGHPLIVEYDENGQLGRVMVPEHEGERGTVISPEEREHADVCREHDPPDVLLNMGQGHPLRVEYKDCGAVGNMWIPMWRCSPEVLNGLSDDEWIPIGESQEDVENRKRELNHPDCRLDQPPRPSQCTPVADGGAAPVPPGIDPFDNLLKYLPQTRAGPKHPSSGSQSDRKSTKPAVSAPNKSQHSSSSLSSCGPD